METPTTALLARAWRLDVGDRMAQHEGARRLDGVWQMYSGERSWPGSKSG